jgi:hypothetical protein
MVVVAQPVQSPDQISALSARLADPAVAASLNQLLDHVDLLAILVAGLDGLVRRGDTISDSLVAVAGELRGVQHSAGLPDAARLLGSAQRLGAILGPAMDLLPTVEYLLRSDLGDTRMVDVAAMASRAVVVATERSAAAPERERRPGLRSMWKALRDSDTRRALGFGLAVAKALGKELNDADAKPAGTR